MVKASEKNSKSYVSVGCRIPMGLKLRLFEMVKTNEPVMGGGFREVSVARQVNVGSEAMLNGFATPQGVSAAHEIIGGYGITHNVDRETIEKFLRDNEKSDFVRNRLVFIQESPDDARAEAKELAKNLSGMERLDPDHLPNAMKKIETADVK